ncbi:MAG: ATPase [Desulfobacteraceae bacterium IS3]|nr:MAG: ATPase [Desulfobacteraceae bacterium IS3]
MNIFSLHSLTAKNYKNLLLEDGAELKNLNIFIGPNGCGKSNTIAVLEFLKNCILSGSDESGVSPFEEAVSRLGGSKILDKTSFFPGKISFSFRFSQSPEIRKGLHLDLKLFTESKNSKVTIAEEFLSDSLHSADRTPFFYYKYHDRKIGEGVISVWNDEFEQSSHFEIVNNVPTDSLGLTVISELLENSKTPPQQTPVYRVRRQLIDHIKGWRFYNANNMNLETIRNSEPKLGLNDIFLSSSGNNLAIVIENLIQQNIDFEDRLNYAMKSVLPMTRRLRPLRTGLMTINLEWHFDEISEPFYLNEMSDGTVRMLCWATILLSPNLPTLLVIDEPEIGIHPAWMPVLAGWIKRASEQTQVVICTHSPDLLDHFTDCLENVFCFSKKDQNHFSIIPLSHNKLQRMLDEGWKIGDLYRVGDSGVGGWPW